MKIRMPHRRVLAVATLAVLATIGLTACRSQPGVAAYIGDVQIKDAEVDRIVDTDAKAKLDNAVKSAEKTVRQQGLEAGVDEKAIQAAVDQEKAKAAKANTPAPLDLAQQRTEVASYLIMGETAKRIVLAKALPVTPVSAEQLAAQQQQTTVSEFTKAQAKVYPYLAALSKSTAPVTPTKADNAELVATLRSLGATEQEATKFTGAPAFSQWLGMRNELLAGMKKYDVSVSPRYSPAIFPLWQLPNQTGQSFVLLSVAVTKDTGAVTDAPQSAPPAADTQQ